ncbi:MAG: hypothetical protein ABIT71_25130 [Vicinamibacteraceae bacterium]
MSATMSAGEYCRAIEAYLCRENGGHLVRIVGPAFLAVAGWHAAGIPIAVVTQGIDRTLARDRAKPATGAARRPIRVEFCEADVQDAFATWKRAVGVGMAGARDDASPGGPESSATGAQDAAMPAMSGPRPGRGPSLAAHVDRAMQRLTQALLDLGRFGPDEAGAARTAMEAALGTLDRLQSAARGARGETRTGLIASLADADAALGAALIAALSAAAATDLARAARAELAPFAGRMAAPDLASAEAASLARLARDRFRAPELTPRA